MDGIETYLPPGAAMVISLLTIIFTKRRTDQLEERAAHVEERAVAKDTVDMLANQNEALRQDVLDLRGRVAGLETAHEACEQERARLLAEVLNLRPKT